MDKATAKTVRLLGFCALLAAGSCSITPDRNPGAVMPDGAVNHPIMVEPSYRSLKLDYPVAGLPPSAAAQLDAFVSDYRDHGSGSIAVSAPDNASAQGAIAFFAEHINRMGISRDKILVSTHDAPDGDMRVEINYVAYKARTEKCGDWSDDLGFTARNDTPKNFGCAVQQNIAAMVADPRDLLGPRPLGESDGARRVTVMGKYETGEITSANKRSTALGNEQSGTSSQVGQ
jgi:pilus assembly protein CpaD